VTRSDGTGWRDRWQRSFMGSIVLVALLAIIGFAFLIGRVVRSQIEDQATERAEETAALMARAAFAPRLPARGERLAGADVAELDRQVDAVRGSEPRVEIVLWSGDGEVLYSSPPERGSVPPAVKTALAGEPTTSFKRDGATDTSASARVTAAVPVLRRRGDPIAAALELRLPYAPFGRDIRDRSRRLDLALLGTGLVAWLLALPALLRARRALRAQYDPRRVAVTRELRQAIDRGELLLHFHPIARVDGRRVETAEALIRWHHPTRGPIPPDAFIPVVEPTEVMWPLTVHIFELVARQQRDWRAQGIEVRIAVNVSSLTLLDSRLPGEIARVFEAHGVPAWALEVEVTEGAVMQDPATATRVLGQITDLGVDVVAIDDFGTGYSSLARLHELPLNALKIDQSFVRRMRDEDDDAVVRSVIELGHALGLELIAEGVEDEETRRQLETLGCDYVQGYLLTRPLAGDEFARWLTAQQAHAG